MAQFKPKSRFAAVTSRPKLRISKADWVRIEAAYGHLLAAPVRRKIRAVTREPSLGDAFTEALAHP